MPNGQAGGTDAVAKVQKTVTLPAELCQLIKAHETQTGASLSKIVTAALLQHFLSDPLSGPDTEWMSTAVALDRGDLTVGGAPGAMQTEMLKWANFNLRLAKQSKNKVRLAEAEASLEEVQTLKREWQANVEEFGGGMEALLWAVEKHSKFPKGAHRE